MQWSKAKQRVEALFSPAIASRVELCVTGYREAHDAEAAAGLRWTAKRRGASARCGSTSSGTSSRLACAPRTRVPTFATRYSGTPTSLQRETPS